LGLLVHAQDQGLVRRVKIKAHNVADFFHEERVGREFEALGAVRLESEELEVAADGALGDSALLGDQTHTPVGGALGFGVQNAIDEFRHLLIAMATWASRPQFIVQAGEPMFAVALTPQADGGRGHRAAFGNGLVRQSRGRQQHYIYPPYQRMRHTARTRQRFQLLAFQCRQHHHPIWPAHRASSFAEDTRNSSINKAIYGTLH
jgi:hypothetical protein